MSPSGMTQTRPPITLSRCHMHTHLLLRVLKSVCLALVIVFLCVAEVWRWVGGLCVYIFDLRQDYVDCYPFVRINK